VGYPERLLHEGEDVELELRRHWTSFARPIVIGIALFLTLAAVLSIGDDGVRDILRYPVVGLAVLWSIWMVVELVRWSAAVLVLTNQRLIYRAGVIAHRGVEIPLDAIATLHVRQRLWERVLGTGDLEVQALGYEGAIRFEYVRYPDGVQREIEHLMATGGFAPAFDSDYESGDPEAGGHGGAAIPEQIAQLGALRDRGLISDDEYEDKKRELLDRM